MVAEDKGKGDIVDGVGLGDAQQRLPQLVGVVSLRVVAHQHHQIRLQRADRLILQPEIIGGLSEVVRIVADGALVGIAHQHDPEMVIVKLQ